MVECLLCNMTFLQLTSSHLRAWHNTSMEEYRCRFPDAVLCSVETCGRISQGKIDSYEVNPSSRLAISIALQGKEVSEITRQLLSNKLSGVSQVHVLTDEGRKNISQAALKRVVTLETRELLSKSHIGLTQSVETIRCRCDTFMASLARDLTIIERIKHTTSQSKLGHEVSELTRQRIAESLHLQVQSEETRRKRSESFLKLWEDPKFVKRQVVSWTKHPNLSEARLDDVLQRNFPNTFKFVGNSIEGHIGRKVADFIDVKGLRIVIEMFGLWYHDPDAYPNRMTEKELIVYYKDLGYTCLVFWEDVVWCDEQLIIDIVKHTFEEENNVVVR